MNFIMTDTTTSTPDATVTASVSVDPTADTTTVSTSTTIHLSILADIAQKIKDAGAVVDHFVEEILAKAKEQLAKL
jgi:hypothetical protein